MWVVDSDITFLKYGAASVLPEVALESVGVGCRRSGSGGLISARLPCRWTVLLPIRCVIVRLEDGKVRLAKKCNGSEYM